MSGFVLVRSKDVDFVRRVIGWSRPSVSSYPVATWWLSAPKRVVTVRLSPRDEYINNKVIIFFTLPNKMQIVFTCYLCNTVLWKGKTMRPSTLIILFVRINTASQDDIAHVRVTVPWNSRNYCLLTSQYIFKKQVMRGRHCHERAALPWEGGIAMRRRYCHAKTVNSIPLTSNKTK